MFETPVEENPGQFLKFHLDIFLGLPEDVFAQRKIFGHLTHEEMSSLVSPLS